MKKKLIFMIIAIGVLQVNAITPTKQWVKISENTREITDVSSNVLYFQNNLEKIAIDKDSCVFVAGEATKQFSFGDFDILALSGGSAYLLKYKKDGTPDWGVFGNGGCSVSNIAVDNSGNVYMVGKYAGNVDFYSTDGTTIKTAKGNATESFKDRAYVVKFNKEGIVQWVRGDSIIFDINDCFNERYISNDGIGFRENGVVVGGSFCGPTKTFGNEISSGSFSSENVSADIYNLSSYYVTLDGTNGNVKFQPRIIQAASKLYNRALYIGINYIGGDSILAFYLNGKYQTKDSTLIQRNDNGKYANGIIFESKGSTKLITVDTNSTALQYFLTLDIFKTLTDGSILVGGAFQSKLKLDATNTLTAPAGFTHYYLAKMDASLNVTWATSFGSDAKYINAFSSAEPKGVSIAANDNNIVVFGEYKGKMSLGNLSVTSTGDSTDCFMAVFNNTTNAVDTLVSLGGSKYPDYVSGVAMNASNEIAVSGFFKSNNASNFNFLGTQISTNDSAKIFVSKVLLSSKSTPTGIISYNSNNLKILLYPIPVVKDLNVLTDKEVESIFVYDLIGKNVASSLNQKVIDLSELATGIYMIVVNIEGKKIVSKIIKK